MRIILFLFSLTLIACAPLHRSDPVRLVPMYIGTIKNASPITIGSGETISKRAAMGVMSLNPFVVAAATITEPNLNKSSAFLYLIQTNDGKETEVVSFSINKKNDCVKVIETANSSIQVLEKITLSKCA